MLKITTPKKGDVLFLVNAQGNTSSDGPAKVTVSVEEITIISAGKTQIHFFLNRLGRMSHQRLYTESLTNPRSFVYLTATREEITTTEPEFTALAQETLARHQKWANEILEMARIHSYKWADEHQKRTDQLNALRTIPVIINHH